MKTHLRTLLVLVFSIMAMAGCERATKLVQGSNGHQHGTPVNWKFTLPAGNAAEGRKLFVAAACHKCHEVKGESFPAVAKETSDVGAELAQMVGMHPPEFFAESIINPSAVIDTMPRRRAMSVQTKSPRCRITTTLLRCASLRTLPPI